MNLLQDPWLSNVPLNMWPTFINISAQWANMKVQNLISAHGTWDTQKLTTLFPLEMMNQICYTPLAQEVWSN